MQFTYRLRSYTSRLLRSVIACGLFIGVAGQAWAATCESVGRLAFPAAQITSSAVVYAGRFKPPAEGTASSNAVYERLPSFCRVTATLTPSADSEIAIEVWMPAENWNGKFQALGNGGWAGRIGYADLANAVALGYGTAATDAGHTGNSGAFAVGHPEKVTDMAYRAVHEMTVHAKAIIAAYYETGPRQSIWNACSTGGRQGIGDAIRYPEDFEAVIAGAPAVNWMDLHVGRLALHQAVNRHGTPLPASKYPLVHAGVLAACDASDGVADGVLENPAACRFDPGVLACTDADTSNCLTPPEVASARAFYEPIRTQDGTVVMPGLERGSELGWGTLGGPEPLGNALDGVRYVVHQDPAWDWRMFVLDTDLALAQRADPDGSLSVRDPDLRAFFDRGGRLLMYHGWNDPQVPPGNTLRFWDEIVRRYGDAVGRSVQLYMIPGMNHCTGGPGTDRFNMMAALEQWAAAGRAPERIPAAHLADGVIDRTRPLCAYPQVAKYAGSGSIDAAESFVCAAPQP